MTVPRALPEYIVNIMKSAVQPLRIHPLIGHLQEVRTSPYFPPVFNKMEETIFGRCECQYVFGIEIENNAYTYIHTYI